ncbi:MAG TPA: hypothetical protein VGD31_08410, partial [Sphingobacteriaceae bacterium]
TSCSNENPLNGRTFLLLNAGVEKTTSTTLLQFSSKEYVEVFNIKNMLTSNNSYSKTPYRVKGNILSINGVSYSMENNKDGFNLYKGQILEYRLLESKEDLVGKLLTQPLVNKDK